MPGVAKLGEEFKVLIDIDHDAGGVWGVANYVKLRSRLNVDPNPGIIVAEFDFADVEEQGARRSLLRKPVLGLEVGIYHGDPAFDRLYEAAYDRTNNGTEILRVVVSEGEFLVAGHRYNERDMIVTDVTPSTQTGNGAALNLTLMAAIDSPNTPVLQALTT